MATLPTPAELIAVGRAAFRTAIDPAGTGAVNLRPGSRNDALISLLATTLSRHGRYVADRVSARLLGSATDADLDDLARDLWGEERKPAVAATGVVQLSRPGTTPTTIPRGSRFAVPAAGTQPAVTFEAAEDVATSAAAVVVPIVCSETGERGNLTAGGAAITAILDPLPDTTWTLDTDAMEAVPADFVVGGGSAVETDDELTARLGRVSPEAMRERGTLAAVTAGTLRVPGVKTAVVIEPFDGTIVIYAGDANDALPTALHDAIETELLNWRPFGVRAIVRRYTVQIVQVVGTIHMSRALANYDLSAIRASAVANIREYFAGRTNPDEYFLNGIEAACFRAHDEVQDVVLASPEEDVKRPADTAYSGLTQINRYRLGAIELNVDIPRRQT